MDTLDVRILRAMDLLPYGSKPRDPSVFKPTYLADQVDRTPDTVKARIEGLEDDGVLLGYQAVPNLAHLDLSAQAHLFSVDDAARKETIVQQVADLPGLLALHDYIGEELCAEYAYHDQDEEARILDALMDATRDPEPSPFYDGVMPSVDRELTNLDWRILASLRWEATKPLREVANEVGVTRRTVKRRYDRMAHEGSFVTVPILDPSQAPGLILFELMIHTEDDADRAMANRVLDAYEAKSIFHYVPTTQELGNVNLLMFARTPAQVEELRRRGEGLPGVERVEAGLFTRFIDRSRWLDDEIQAKITATAPA